MRLRTGCAFVVFAMAWAYVNVGLCLGVFAWADARGMVPWWCVLPGMPIYLEPGNVERQPGDVVKFYPYAEFGHSAMGAGGEGHVSDSSRVLGPTLWSIRGPDESSRSSWSGTLRIPRDAPEGSVYRVRATIVFRARQSTEATVRVANGKR